MAVGFHIVERGAATSASTSRELERSGGITTTTCREWQSWRRLVWVHSQLTSVSHLASLMSFFAVTAAVELPVSDDLHASPNLVTAFVTVTCSLVGLTVFTRLVAASTLPQLESVLEVGETYARWDSHRAPHDALLGIVESACVAGQSVAPFLFCTDLILLAWIKFESISPIAPIAATIILIPTQVVIVIIGRKMWKKRHSFRAEHYLLVPDRRYSEIAETWDEDDDDDEEKSLLGSSSRPSSYGSLGQDAYLKHMKQYAEVFV